MIKRFVGTTPTRSRAVAHGGIVYAVATAKNKAAPLYEQTKDALPQIDSTVADAGSDKSRILRATIYITDMSRKPDLDRAWDEWVGRANPPQRACIGVTLADKDLVEILVSALSRTDRVARSTSPFGSTARVRASADPRKVYP